MMLKMAHVITRAPEERQDLAMTIMPIATGDSAMKRLASLVAEALYRGEKVEQS